MRSYISTLYINIFTYIRHFIYPIVVFCENPQNHIYKTLYGIIFNFFLRTLNIIYKPLYIYKTFYISHRCFLCGDPQNHIYKTLYSSIFTFILRTINIIYKLLYISLFTNIRHFIYPIAVSFLLRSTKPYI